MSAPKITVAFYSTYGTNHAVAEAAAEAARAEGAEVKLVRFAETAPDEVVQSQEPWAAQLEKMKDIPVATPADFADADGIWVSVPTRFGGAASQYRAFVDTLGPLWQEGALVGKAFTATTSAANPNGGVEQTLMNIYSAAMHWSAVIVPPGYGDAVKFTDGGNPYGYSTKPGEFDEAGQKSVAYQMGRLVQVAGKLAG